MSVVTRTKRLTDIRKSSPAPEAAPTAPAFCRGQHEAPERSTLSREAPESTSRSHAEAPDAGNGSRYVSFGERDFTQGRSQS